MPAKINLINQIFGKLTVIEETEKRKNRSVVWKCRCECGNIIELSTKELRSDGIQMCQECGNSRKPQIELTENIINKQFGHLVVLEATDKRQSGKILYKCQCECGNICYRTRTDLQKSEAPYCGQQGCITQLKYHIGDIINNKQVIGYGYTKNNRFYYKVKCLLCGNEYKTMGQSLERSVGCGCQNSKGELIISQLLIANKIKFATQYTFKELGKKRYDFAILNNDNIPIRLIEFDGEQHFINNIKNSGWNNQEHFNKVSESDSIKNLFALSHDIPLIRIPYWEREKISLDMIFSDKYLVKK